MLAWARWWVTNPDPTFVRFAVAMLGVEGYYDGLTLAQITDALYQLQRQYFTPPQVPQYTIAWPSGGETEQEMVAAWKTWVDADLLPGLTATQIAAFLGAFSARLTAVHAYQ